MVEELIFYLRVLLASPFIGIVATCEGLGDFILPKSIKLESTLEFD